MPISLLNLEAKFLKKILTNWIHQCIKNLYTLTKQNLSQVCKTGVALKKINQYNSPYQLANEEEPYDYYINWHRKGI